MRGELAAFITGKYDDYSTIVGTNKAYAAIQHFSKNAGRNKKIEIPARPYLKLIDKQINEIIL